MTAATKLKDVCSLEGKLRKTKTVYQEADITLLTKVHVVKAMLFPVFTYGCESWTIKKVEHQNMDAFTTVVLEKTIESLLDSKEIQPVISKGNQP